VSWRVLVAVNKKGETNGGSRGITAWRDWMPLFPQMG